MKKISVVCPYCGEKQKVERKTYDEHLQEIISWRQENINDEAANDAYEHIIESKNNKEVYLDFYYSVTPNMCILCKDTFIYHKGKYEYIKHDIDKINIYNSLQKMIKTKPADGYVYFIKNKENGLIKIGCSKNPIRRQKEINHENKIETTMLLQLKSIDENAMYEVENKIHKHFKKYRVSGEWFLLPENTVKALLAEGKTYHYIKEVIADMGVKGV